jgi:hypothetical protein
MSEQQKQEFVTYKKFNFLFDAEPLIEVLLENEIEYEIENASPAIDITFSANTMHNEYRIKIAPEDFSKLEHIIQERTKLILDQIEDDHYFHEFSETELIEVLQKPDEWSTADVIIARKMLEDRGKKYSDDEIQAMRNRRIAQLTTPAPRPDGLILSGWILVALGGIFGFFIGWYLNSFKKTIFSGEQVWAFDNATRKEGANMFIAGVIVHILSLLIYFFKLYQVFI